MGTWILSSCLKNGTAHFLTVMMSSYSRWLMASNLNGYVHPVLMGGNFWPW